MNVTRRALARMLAATAAVPSLAAGQTQPDEPAASARQQFERSAQAMQAVKVPISTEPPFHFKA